jgi:Leucine-rich repeat (LRR) protein
LTRLAYLQLESLTLNDLSPLKKLNNLTEMVLSFDKVKPSEVKAIQKALPKLNILAPDEG